MYEDSVCRSRLVPRPVKWLRLWFASFVAVGIVCLFFSGIGAAVGCLAGCAGHVSARTYGPDDADVAGRNARALPGFSGVTDNAPAIVDGVAGIFGDLAAWGAPAVLLGCVLIWRPESPTGLGAGLVCGGCLLLLAGALLPLFCGWIGLGVVGLFAALWMARKSPATGQSPLNSAGSLIESAFSRLKALFV